MIKILFVCQRNICRIPPGGAYAPSVQIFVSLHYSACLLLAQSLLDCQSLTGIIHGRAGSVGVDIDLFCAAISCLRQSLFHSSGTAFRFGMGCGDVVCVAGRAIATDFTVNPCTTLRCIKISNGANAVAAGNQMIPPYSALEYSRAKVVRRLRTG